MTFRSVLVMPIVLAFAMTTRPVLAEASATEERFQDLFITAGYCSAFGAAFGTALLAFTAEPTENLRYVAVGASLGFIGGTALGSYIIFSPMVASSHLPNPQLALGDGLPARKLLVRPTFDTASNRFRSIEGALTLANF